jgi:hypothetical protein
MSSLSLTIVDLVANFQWRVALTKPLQVVSRHYEQTKKESARYERSYTQLDFGFSSRRTDGWGDSRPSVPASQNQEA